MINKDVLTNGLTVVSEEISYAQSVSVGIWVKTGSRHESLTQAGISHFLEHMNFKGTEKRTARELAEILECRGGQLNAFTAKDYTNYYAQAVKEDYRLAIDVLADIFCHSVFDEEETEKEKNVVLEEINLYEDSPEDLVIDMLNESCWPEQALGRPILGYEKQVRSFTPTALKEYRRHRYTPEQTVVAVVGAFEHEAILEAIEESFAGFGGQTVAAGQGKPIYHKAEKNRQKDIAQQHICFAFPACSFFDADYFPGVLVNEYLGGGASSLLFQKIREELALSYSVYSFLTAYEDTGLLMVYAGTAPEAGDKVIEQCLAEIKRLCAVGIDENELNKLKNQISGSMRISVDSLGSRLNRLGRNELFHHRQISIEEIVTKIEGITTEDFNGVAQKMLDLDQMSLVTLGGKSCRE